VTSVDLPADPVRDPAPDPTPASGPAPGPAPAPGRGPRRSLLPIVAVLAAMSSVQIGSAVSVPLFATLGVAGTTWLRLTVAAVILLAVARPRGMRRRDVAVAAGLGAVMAANAVLFSAATDRIPLGTVVAVEFCGPLAVAALGARGGGLRRSLWPALALAGVLVITRPWRIGGAEAGSVWLGLACAAVAATGWAGYIVLTAHVGRRSEGLQGLAVAVASSAVVLAPLGAVQAWPVVRAAFSTLSTTALSTTAVSTSVLSTEPGISGGDARTALVRVVLAALLVPLAAYALEMTALRHLDQGVFGVWMALEPAIGTLAGLALLGQHVAVAQLPGVALVVAAGIGAQRGR
jgi:inner membrane transporter RhtA